jgi:hypothetical protein
MSSTRQRHVWAIGLFAIKLAGTIGFLWWVLSGLEENESLGRSFQTALRSPLWVAYGLSMALISLVANAVRWQFLLWAQSIHQPFSYILRLTFYGAFFNIASFGSAAGDAVKIFLLMRREPEKKLGVTISVMVDHVIGIVATCFIFLVFTWGFGTLDNATGPEARTAFIAATWFQVGGLTLTLLSVLSCAPPMLAIGRRIVPRLINNRWVAATYYLTFHAGLRSLGSDIPATTVMAVMPIVDVIAALPISVSGLGVREQAFDFLLHLLTGIETSQAVAASLIGFLFQLFWGLVGGLVFLTARSRKPILPCS